MKPRASRTALLAGALVLPLAFTPLMTSIEDTGQQRNDGKARALAALADDAHADLDAAKQAHIELAMEEAELFAGQEAPAPVNCFAGFAGPYPCENIDLAAIVPLAELGGAAGNDSWGWVHEETGREFAIMGTGVGVAFIEITDPRTPIVRGFVETEVVDSGALWRDLKVHDDHAFIVSENNDHGMQVFDLTRLLDAGVRETFTPDAVYDGFGGAHNISINEATATAYAVGTDTCNAGLHMVDISDPLNPEPYVAKGELGDGKFGELDHPTPCYASDFYTHDVHCVIYRGPDVEHQGDEICLASNEDSVTIVKIAEGSAPQLLAKVGYDTAGYTHQGRLTDDHRWFIFNDELDEDPVLGSGRVDNTTTYILDVKDLDLGFVLKDSDEYEPSRSGRYRSGEAAGNVYEDENGDPLVKPWSHETISIDHNLEITDNLIWEANYNAGLRVLRYTDEGLANGELEEVGFFDVDPGVDVKAYGDSWNVYPYFPSGTVIVSNIGQGLLVLQPDMFRLGHEDVADDRYLSGDAGDGDGSDDDGRPGNAPGDRPGNGPGDRPGNGPDDRPGRP